MADFNFGYRPIDGRYPTASPGVYVVGAGDTLESIARSAYGDSALWYRLAEANGLSSNNDLKVGQSLTIPNRVGTESNNASTFKPYDPSAVTGCTTPDGNNRGQTPINFNSKLRKYNNNGHLAQSIRARAAINKIALLKAYFCAVAHWFSTAGALWRLNSANALG